MKKILHFATVTLTATALFTGASAFRIFQIDSLALIAESLLYFLIGLCLHKYYNEQKVVLPFFVITAVWSFSMLLLPNLSNILLVLITALLIVVNLSLGYFISSFPIRTKYIAVCAMLGLVSYLSFKYLPQKGVQNKMVSYSNLLGKSFLEFMPNVMLKDTANNLAINYFVKDSIYLLEFYFKNCAPCKMKEKILPSIAQEFKNKPFKIVYMDNAKLDNFQTFRNESKNKSYADNFYDENNKLVQNLNIQSFPLEIIIDKKGMIRHTYHGFSFEDDNEYFKITTTKIKELLNE